MSRFEIVSSVIQSEKDKPYVYGKSDCFFLGLRMVDALSGTKHVKTYAKRYTSLMGAQKALIKEGHKTLSDLFASFLPSVSPAMATLGDVGVIDLDGVQHVGVCLGNGFLIRTEDGWHRHGLDKVIYAFRVQ